MADFAGIVVDLTEVNAKLAKALRAAGDLTPAWRRARGPLRKDQREHASSTAGPDGAWAPLSRQTLERRLANAATRKRQAGKTVKRRRSHSRRTLKQRRLLGRLPGLIDVKLTPTSMIASSKVRWAGAHQRGETVGRGVRLPTREFLWASPQLIDHVCQILCDHLMVPWGVR